MKNLMFVAILMVLVTGLCFSAYAGESRININVNAGFFSKYVGNITGVESSKYPSTQQIITISDTKTGIYGGIWNAVNMGKGYNKDFGSEQDFFLGIVKKYSEITINTGIAYYNLYNLSLSRGDLVAIYLHPTFPKIWLDLIPYACMEYHIPTNHSVLPGGFVYKLGAKKDFDILIADLSIGGHDGAHGNRTEWLSYTRLSFSKNLKVKDFTITPSINFQKRLGYKIEAGGKTKDNVWGGINFSYTF